MNVEASLHGVVTTHGASHAFDLIARYRADPRQCLVALPSAA